MPKYLGLFNWTDAGMRSAKDTVTRARASREEFKAPGIRMEQIYWALGPYDIVVMFEAPDDEAIVKAKLASIAKGNLRWTMMRLFDEVEMGRLVQQLA